MESSESIGKASLSQTCECAGYSKKSSSRLGGQMQQFVCFIFSMLITWKTVLRDKYTQDPGTAGVDQVTKREGYDREEILSSCRQFCSLY